MIFKQCLRWTLLLLWSATALGAQEELQAPLEPLRPLLGTPWKAQVGQGEDGSPIFDVSLWERALNGKAVRILHSVNDGDYGGETLIRWDREKMSLVYTYFTTAEFVTEGTMSIEGRKVTSHEVVSGNSTGITEVQSISELKKGRLHVKTRMLRDGEWQERPEVIYVKDPSARVVFR